jgi:hypothetical protein
MPPDIEAHPTDAHYQPRDEFPDTHAIRKEIVALARRMRASREYAERLSLAAT